MSARWAATGTMADGGLLCQAVPLQRQSLQMLWSAGPLFGARTIHSATRDTAVRTQPGPGRSRKRLHACKPTASAPAARCQARRTVWPPRCGPRRPAAAGASSACGPSAAAPSAAQRPARRPRGQARPRPAGRARAPWTRGGTAAGRRSRRRRAMRAAGCGCRPRIPAAARGARLAPCPQIRRRPGP